MSERTLDDPVTREILSALADGQADADEVSRACGAWRHHPQVRETWHAYHLIGEAMRSPEQPTASDSEAFLQRMRARLAAEPVVLSPQPAQAQSQARVAAQASRDHHLAAPVQAQPLNRRVWAGPMAVAASFAIIVGALTVNLGEPAVNPDGAQLARSGVGWAESSAQPSVLASALGTGGSFSAARSQRQTWQSLDPSLEQSMVLQRPQPSPPATFSAAPGVDRVGVMQTP